MNEDHPLSNPTSEQLDQVERATIDQNIFASNDSFVAPAPDQMSLALPRDGKLSTSLHNIRVFLKKREMEMEAMPFWRDLASPLAVVSSTLLVLIVFIYGLIQFNNIPPRIQFYYDAIQSRWEQADKIVVLILPVVLLVLDILILRFIYDIFRYDRRLSRVLSWVLSIFNLLTIVAIGQIYSLI